MKVICSFFVFICSIHRGNIHVWKLVCHFRRKHLLGRIVHFYEVLNPQMSVIDLVLRKCKLVLWNPSVRKQNLLVNIQCVHKFRLLFVSRSVRKYEDRKKRSTRDVPMRGRQNCIRACQLRSQHKRQSCRLQDDGVVCGCDYHHFRGSPCAFREEAFGHIKAR